MTIDEIITEIENYEFTAIPAYVYIVFNNGLIEIFSIHKSSPGKGIHHEMKYNTNKGVWTNWSTEIEFGKSEGCSYSQGTSSYSCYGMSNEDLYTFVGQACSRYATQIDKEIKQAMENVKLFMEIKSQICL